MKKSFLFFVSFLFLIATYQAQNIVTRQSNEPVFIKIKSHDSNIAEVPEKSFYESKSDWQYIIDTTWGSGLPLQQKQQIFNSYADAFRESFDGFESLQMNVNSWDSLRNHYYSLINDSTSRGGFSAIMTNFSMQFRDLHTYAYDDSVVFSPLNPGVPVLIIGSYSKSVEHFGAVLTALPDSSLLILRTIDNHPLDLQPGDILLGYEGVPWKVLVNELIEARLPIIGRWGGAPSAYRDEMLLGAGLSWHLFSMIDILKHSTGDTVHLPVYPLLNLPPASMLNNEQLPILGVPFPDYDNGQYVSYGIIEGTNIGYIYLYQEVQGTSDQQFYAAVTALQETDALIIDMRLNYGGWAFFNSSLNLLFNEDLLTIEDSYRCNINDFTLCPSGNSITFKVPGNPPDFYDRPIAIFLGPTCVSMGDVTAQRFRYHPTVRFFGKSSAASLGDNLYIENFPDWTIRYSISDMFHVTKPEEYLNRTEFPVDYPIWFNPEDVANGYDTVVEEALEWINNLVYGHDVLVNNHYITPGSDTVIVSAIVENPNSHNVNTKIFIRDLENVIVDSLELIESEKGNFWQGGWPAINEENILKLDIKVTDQSTGSSFIIENVNRLTTAGPIEVNNLIYTYNPIPKTYTVKATVKNSGQTAPVKNIRLIMSTEDSSVTYLYGSLTLDSIAAQQVTQASGSYTVRVDTNLFSGVFHFKVDINSDGWPYWKHEFDLPVGVEELLLEPFTFGLEQNYPNPFNPSTKIKYYIPERSFVTLKIYDVLGNEMETILNKEQPQGVYEIEFDGNTLSSGVYLYKLETKNYSETRKMILLK